MKMKELDATEPSDKLADVPQQKLRLSDTLEFSKAFLFPYVKHRFSGGSRASSNLPFPKSISYLPPFPLTAFRKSEEKEKRHNFVTREPHRSF